MEATESAAQQGESFIELATPAEAHWKAEISLQQQEKAFDMVWCDIWLCSTVHAHLAVNPVTFYLLRDPCRYQLTEIVLTALFSLKKKKKKARNDFDSISAVGAAET